MRKQEYDVLAQAFKNLRWHNRHEVIDGLMLWMKDMNPRFDEGRFSKASQFSVRYSLAPWRVK